MQFGKSVRYAVLAESRRLKRSVGGCGQFEMSNLADFRHRPLPHPLIGPGQFDIAGLPGHDLQPARPDRLTILRTAHTAPEPRSRFRQPIIPMPPLEMPPQTMGLEPCAVPAGAIGLDRIVERRCLEERRRDHRSVFRPTHVTTAVAPGQRPVSVRVRPGPGSRAQVHSQRLRASSRSAPTIRPAPSRAQ